MTPELRARFDADSVAEAARATARMVRMHRSIGTAARRKRLPPSKFPRLIENDYAARIAALVHAQRQAVAPLIAALPDLLASAAAARGDAADAGDILEFAGFPIVLENRKGTTRQWIDSDGTAGSTVMKFDYGYIDGVIGVDGEEVDVYLGPDPASPWVHVVQQNKKPVKSNEIRRAVWKMYGVPLEPEIEPSPEFDEQKVMLGWASADQARDAYLAQYDDPRFFGGMIVMSVDEFRRALASVGTSGVISSRMDAGEARRAQRLLESARAKLVSTVQPSQLDALASRYAQLASQHQKSELQRQTKAQLGIDVHTIDRYVPALIDHYVAENVSLIKTMGTNTMDKVEKMVTRSLSTGARHEELARDIMDEFDVAERHARLIARDQIGKLYGQLAAERHYELGVRRFRWVTVGDDRVRDSHAEFERQSDAEPFLYDDPPIDDNGEAVLPGEAICCRCSADPVFDDILDAAEED